MDESDLNTTGLEKIWITALPHDLQASCFSKLFAALCWLILYVHCRQAAKYDANKCRPRSRLLVMIGCYIWSGCDQCCNYIAS